MHFLLTSCLAYMEDVKWFQGTFTVARHPLDRFPPPHIPPQGWQIVVTEA